MLALEGNCLYSIQDFDTDRNRLSQIRSWQEKVSKVQVHNIIVSFDPRKNQNVEFYNPTYHSKIFQWQEVL